MTSKLLQLQFSKSKRSSKKHKKKIKKPAPHVLYVFDGTVSGVVPLVAGQENLNCTFWTLGETPASWTISKWISLLLQMLSLVFVWRHLTCNMSCLRPPLAHQWTVRAVECGGEGESPLSASCCGPLGGWQKHFLLHLLLSLARKQQPAKTWQHPSPALPPPTLTPLTQRSL